MSAPNPLAVAVPAARAPARGVRPLYWAMPALAVALFVVAMAVLLWVLRNHELEQSRNALVRDIQWAEQTIRLHLQSNHEAVQQIARDLALGGLDEETFQIRASQQIANNRELVGLLWVGADTTIRWAAPFEAVTRLPGEALTHRASLAAFRAAAEQRRTEYSEVFPAAQNEPTLEAHVPLFRERQFVGTVAAVYSVRALVYSLVPSWFAEKYQLAVVDPGGETIASTAGAAHLDPLLSHEISFDPLGHGLRLRATAFKTDSRLGQNMLFALVVGLSGMIVWSLWALRSHLVQRTSAEERLRGESAFRKSIEDSVLTGIRVVDMEGRITYVNSAFCRMTGYGEQDLVGARAPMPYWPAEERAACWAALEKTLAGEAPANGFELRLQRKNGECFDVILFVSPLVDAEGRQTGWIASVADITERKRAREALRASHERFTAVLEGIDAAVAVSDAATAEVLFFNGRAKDVYRPVFGGGRTTLLAQDAAAGEQEMDEEVLGAADGRWYHVRNRPIRWVDGRAARIEFATDITVRKQAEELSRQQLEKLQITSRLTTMGEMASTLAHELNQPLSAIANYCMGCVTRIQNGASRPEELLAAMHKASLQAQRAGKIIRRVREFVKKSTPHCTPCAVNAIVEEAVGFAEIDAQKKGFEIRCALEPDLPPVSADPIMIEQVLLNLIRNATDAMQDVAPARRRVEVRSAPGEPGMVEVSVADGGHGIAPADLDKLFSPFFTTKPEGMGMGLSICRSIMEFHKGRLWVEPNPAGGSVFRFTLPVVRG